MGISFSTFSENINDSDSDINVGSNSNNILRSNVPSNTPPLVTIPKKLEIPEIIIEEDEDIIEEDEDIIEEDEDIIEEDDENIIEINSASKEGNKIQENINQNNNNTNNTNNLDINLHLLESVNYNDNLDSDSDSDLDLDLDSNTNYQEKYKDIKNKYETLYYRHAFLQNEYYSLSKTYLESKTKILSQEKIINKLKYIKTKNENKLELKTLENSRINYKLNSFINGAKPYKKALDKLNFRFLRLQEENEELKYHHNLIRKKLKIYIDQDTVKTIPLKNRRHST